jgi:hypothetical protein
MNDGRATSTCSLGPLISAEIAAADSLQENGLVKFKGNAELSGIFRPALGTVVTFEYTMDGMTRTVPKKMRVLSSFANPLTRTTSVELGCLLTYKADLREPEKIDTELANKDFSLVAGSTTWDNFPALGAAYSSSWGAETEKSGGGLGLDNSYWTQDYKKVGASITAKWAFKYCLEKLGMTSSAIPLTNKFRLQEFDFSGGWVQVMSDLLQSESYVGELDYDEVLQIRSLTTEITTGPILYTTDLIQVNPINVGGIPANAVGVEYEVWRLNSTPDPSKAGWESGGGTTGGQGVTEEETTVNPEDGPGWEYSEQNGPSTLVPVKWQNTAGQEQIDLFSCTPSVISKTSYIITAGGKRVPLQTTQIRASTIAAEANNYAGARLKAGSFVDGPVQERTVTTYKYNGNGERTSQTVEKYEAAVAVAGATSVKFWYPSGVVTVGTDLVITERIQVDYYQAGSSECQVTTKWQHWVQTMAGNQASAEAREKAKTHTTAQSFLDQAIYAGIYLIGQSTELTVRSSLGRDRSQSGNTQEGYDTGPSTFRGGYPGRTEIANGRMGANAFSYESGPPDSDSAQREEETEIAWIFGDAQEERRTTLTMPYGDDDEVIPKTGGFGGWTINKSTAQEKALRYGRVQNRLTYGYRNGMEIQMTPWKMPGYAFAPIYLSIDGLVVQYRVNNPSWVLTAGEVVASCNAIYWGVVGTT